MRYRGLCPRKPPPAEPARGRGVFHNIVVGVVFFWLFNGFFLFPSTWWGFRRPSRGCSAFFGWSSFAAALAFSLIPPSEGRLDRRLAVFIAFLFVDKICPNVDFICIFADIFVTL